MERITKIQGLKIYQDIDLQSFTLDTVLLADFVKINRKTKNVLEIGSGNAVLSMLISNKVISSREVLNIDAVEILDKSHNVALKNIKENNIGNINLINCDIKEYRKDEMQVYDMVISNPPYFKYNDNPKQMKQKSDILNARHENTLSLEETIKISARLLKNSGHLYLVFRVNRIPEVLVHLRKYGLSAKHMKLVYTKENKEALICLLDSIKIKTSELHILEPIFVYKDKEKTEYIKGLYSEKRRDNKG
ncbi:tRNA1(Val) (adenine(37)-N6)-methyltransferase [Oceanivirga salmonicida]|uniref:tRNA1(Val) (adenine(37)-N6)-methyltransferase n=1 Tax=Oceanivirga salmonicida TaxID=1769291 RepID=UPI000834EDD8|nr:methyltransferase [Oceanivirga salmonicida]